MVWPNRTGVVELLPERFALLLLSSCAWLCGCVRARGTGRSEIGLLGYMLECLCQAHSQWGAAVMRKDRRGSINNRAGPAKNLMKRKTRSSIIG